MSKQISPFVFTLPILTVYLFALFFLLPSLEELVLEQRSELTHIGKVTNEFDDLLSRIKKDIGRENIEIKVLIGPYFRYIGVIGYLYTDFRPTYYILFDEDFYNELTLKERGGACSSRIRTYLTLASRR